jgi:Xaa-Pro dipeptidase
VLEANRSVHRAAKPGVKWEDMHLLSERVIIEHLLRLKILQQYPIEEIQEKRIAAIFYPHGLGHFYGIFR